MQAEHGSFDAFVWSFVDGTPIVGEWDDLDELPAVTDEATALSKDLKRLGFRFVGPDHDVRVHAGRRTCRRPRGRVLPARGRSERVTDASFVRRDRRRQRRGTTLLVVTIVALTVALGWRLRA